MADQDLSKALLKWVQSFNTSPPATSLSSLRDGQILYQILRDIDPNYFVESLPTPETEKGNNWIPRWQNLKHIDRVVRAYVRDVCGVLDSSTAENTEGGQHVDLKSVAQSELGKGEKDTVNLLKGILRAAMYSPTANQRMGRVVVGLGPDVAKIIAATLAGMEESQDTEEDTVVEERQENKINDDVFGEDTLHMSKMESEAGGRDLGLQEEEKLIQAHRIVRQLEESNAKAATELEDLRKDKASLEEAFESFKYEMENSGQKKSENDAMRELRTQSDRDRDYIAELETEMENIRTAASSHERQLERLKADGDSKQKLKDDLQVVKAERDDLLNKTRANENLRKKIQTLQDQEKQSLSLRDDLRSAQEQLHTLDSLKQRCEALQKANTESMNIIANTEQEIFDQKTSRKRLEHEYKVLQQKWEIARERQVRDHETITDLESKLQALSAENDDSQGGLDDELSKVNHRPSASRQASISVPTADLTILEEKLRALTTRNNKLETDYLDILQDKLGLETTLHELRDPSKEPEENVPFLEQRKKLQAAQADLQKLRETMFATTAELASVKEKLLARADGLTNGDVAGLDKEGEYQALSRAYAELTKHAEDVEADLAEQKSLIRHALLSHAAVLLEPEDVRKRNEYEIVKRQMEEVHQAESNDVIDGFTTEVAGKIETGRQGALDAQKVSYSSNLLVKTLTNMSKQIEIHEATIAALKKQLADEQARPKSTAATGQADEKGLAALKRENALMTSAWYDLTSRLQSHNVSVGRRRDDPKSWLGKQRQLVGLGLR